MSTPVKQILQRRTSDEPLELLRKHRQTREYSAETIAATRELLREREVTLAPEDLIDAPPALDPLEEQLRRDREAFDEGIKDVADHARGLWVGAKTGHVTEAGRHVGWFAGKIAGFILLGIIMMFVAAFVRGCGRALFG